MTEPEMTPAFDTRTLRGMLEDFTTHAQASNIGARSLREVVAETAMTEDIPIQMVAAALKLAENYTAIADQVLGMQSNFVRWLDAVDGKQVAEETGGVDGLGA